MSRFVIIVAMLVCVGVANAEGDAPNPQAEVQALTQGVMQKLMGLMAQMNSAANCPKVCGDGCTAEAEGCIDIPDVMDCAANSAACDAACTELCGCLSACSAECGACNTGELTEKLTCTLQSSTCMGPCEAQCPINEFTKESQAAMDKASSDASKVIAMLMAMIPQQGGAAP